MPFYNYGKELRRDLETLQCWKVGSGGQPVIPLNMRVHIMTYASEQNNVEESERSKVYTLGRANVRLRTIAGEGSTQY